MEKKLNRSIIFCSISFFLSQVLVVTSVLGMDDPIVGSKLSIKDILKKKKYDGDSLEPLKILLMQKPDLFDRNTIRSLSEVSLAGYFLIDGTRTFREQYNGDRRAWVLLSQEERKERFLEIKRYLNINPARLVWNEWGTMCATASYGNRLCFILYQEKRKNPPCSSISEILIEKLSVFNTGLIPDYKVWSNFYMILPHNPKVFFRGLKDVCAYAYGNYSDGTALAFHVLEYCFSSQEKQDNVICATQIDDELFPLAIFMEFPILLKAFLDSRKSFYLPTGNYKIFEIEGVTIPQQYDTYEPYLKKDKEVSFKDLPKKVLSAILVQYNLQEAQGATEVPTKKKKKGRLSCFGS